MLRGLDLCGLPGVDDHPELYPDRPDTPPVAPSLQHSQEVKVMGP